MLEETVNNLAISNALSSLRREQRFPKMVFAGEWKDYLFFEPFLLFQPNFIEVKEFLLSEENASVIALINLGNQLPVNDEDLQPMFLEKGTSAPEYIAKLKGDGSPTNWLFLMDRYVSASDKGNWSIYCEKENDVAVFAIRNTLSMAVCSQVGVMLKAKSIRNVSNSEDNHLFDFDKLVPIWRSSLVAEYVPSRE